MDEDIKQPDGTQTRISVETAQRLRMWRVKLAMKHGGNIPSRDKVISVALDALETLETQAEPEMETA